MDVLPFLPQLTPRVFPGRPAGPEGAPATPPHVLFEVVGERWRQALRPLTFLAREHPDVASCTVSQRHASHSVMHLWLQFNAEGADRLRRRLHQATGGPPDLDAWLAGLACRASHILRTAIADAWRFVRALRRELDALGVPPLDDETPRSERHWLPFMEAPPPVFENRPQAHETEDGVVPDPALNQPLWTESDARAYDTLRKQVQARPLPSVRVAELGPRPLARTSTAQLAVVTWGVPRPIMTAWSQYAERVPTLALDVTAVRRFRGMECLQDTGQRLERIPLHARLRDVLRVRPATRCDCLRGCERCVGATFMVRVAVPSDAPINAAAYVSGADLRRVPLAGDVPCRPTQLVDVC